jgi:MFS transporter, PPP family, 3-phenylpropionic acid transporter
VPAATADRLLAWRLAGYYGAWFALGGVLLPFWPSWLDAHGLTRSQIGVLLAAGMVARILAAPLITRLADRTGERKRLVVVLTVGSFACWSLFPIAGGFAALLALSMLAQGCSSASMPLVEDLTLGAVRAHGLDYGRIRLAGSITFLAAAFGGGLWLSGRAADDVLLLLIALAATVVGAALVLPGRHRIGTPAEPLTIRFVVGLRRVLAGRGFRLMFLASGLIQASHMVYYGFGTIGWRAAGLSDGFIGWLWAEGVIAEIVLFWYGAPLLRRLHPAGMMLLGGGAGALRWLVTALTVDPAALIALQALHGLSFGATHLGAMHFLRERAAPGLSATTQGLHSALPMGVLGGLTMMASGPLHGAFGAGAYHAMALMAAAGAAVAWRLGRPGVG